jgi:hypothetical protein
LCFELCERRAIVLQVLGLAPYRLFPRDADPGEILKNRGLEFRAAAGRIDVLDAQQEPSAGGARHFEIDQRGERMTEMQVSVRRGREAENGLPHGTDDPASSPCGQCVVIWPAGT